MLRTQCSERQAHPGRPKRLSADSPRAYSGVVAGALPAVHRSSPPAAPDLDEEDIRWTVRADLTDGCRPGTRCCRGLARRRLRDERIAQASVVETSRCRGRRDILARARCRRCGLSKLCAAAHLMTHACTERRAHARAARRQHPCTAARRRARRGRAGWCPPQLAPTAIRVLPQRTAVRAVTLRQRANRQTLAIPVPPDPRRVVAATMVPMTAAPVVFLAAVELASGPTFH
jgi:hypothetical protein